MKVGRIGWMEKGKDGNDRRIDEEESSLDGLDGWRRGKMEGLNRWRRERIDEEEEKMEMTKGWIQLSWDGAGK